MLESIYIGKVAQVFTYGDIKDLPFDEYERLRKHIDEISKRSGDSDNG